MDCEVEQNKQNGIELVNMETDFLIKRVTIRENKQCGINIVQEDQEKS